MLPQSISQCSRLVSSLKLELSLAAIFALGVLLVMFSLCKGDRNAAEDLIHVVGFGCFLFFWSWSLYTCYQRKLTRDWQQIISKAVEEVSEHSAVNCQAVENLFHSSARLSADFFGSYTDSQRMSGKELLASTGILNIATEDLQSTNLEEADLFCNYDFPSNQLGESYRGHADRFISGHGENERGEFSIACGRLSPSTGKCWWLECPNIVGDSSPWMHTYGTERVLVTGTFVRDSVTGRPVVRGQWISRSRRQGTLFLRLNGRPADAEGAMSDSSSTPYRSPGNQSTNIIHESEPIDIDSGLESEPLVLHLHQPSTVEMKAQSCRVQPEEPRVVVIYDKTIETLLKAPKKKKSQR